MSGDRPAVVLTCIALVASGEGRHGTANFLPII